MIDCFKCYFSTLEYFMGHEKILFPEIWRIFSATEIKNDFFINKYIVFDSLLFPWAERTLR